MMINNIVAKIIDDSRGDKTIEVSLISEKGIFSASVPSGLSKGKFEAKTVSPEKSLEIIKTVILPAVREKKFSNQAWFDSFLIELDSTKDKSRLGANTILALSLSFARMAAAWQSLKLFEYVSLLFHSDLKRDFFLPRPCFNILEGGRHARNNNLDIQEFMIVPRKDSFEENLNLGKIVFNSLKKLVKDEFGSIEIADEGGVAPPIETTDEAFDFLNKAISESGENNFVELGIDAASSEFFNQGVYLLEGEKKSTEQVIEFYERIIKNNRLIFVEDPFSQDDFDGWKKAMNRFRERVFLVGDDLLATNPERIKMAQKNGLCNAMILKPNQIGTLTEAVEAARLAKDFGWKIVVSHRSGETMDDFIADFAVGVGAEFIKSGAPEPAERMAKYERLLEIEREVK